MTPVETTDLELTVAETQAVVERRVQNARERLRGELGPYLSWPNDERWLHVQEAARDFRQVWELRQRLFGTARAPSLEVPDEGGLSDG